CMLVFQPINEAGGIDKPLEGRGDSNPVFPGPTKCNRAARPIRDAVMFSPRTRVTIVGGRWHVNGSLTYPSSKAEGLLMNVRMVNSIFEDLNKPEFDPETNTEAFIQRVPEYVSSGVRCFTICLQGGFPGYEGAVNSAFNQDGSLRHSYLNRA